MKIENAQMFGKIIREYRKQQKITQSQLAALANTGLRFIGELEKGKPTVQLDKALKTARLLGIPFEIPDSAVLLMMDGDNFEKST